HGNSALIWLGSSPSSYTRAYDFKKGDGTDLVNLCNVLNNTPLNQLQAALPKVWSVDQGFRYCIIMNMFLQTDSYIGSGKDHFEYHEPYHDIFHIFPFDLNEALGGEGRADPRTSPWYNTTNAQKPAIGRTLGFADWRARYIAHYRTILEESFSWTELGGLITKYQNMIRADVARDTKKIYTTQQFTLNVTQDVGGGNRPIKGLRPLIQARESYLKGLSEFNTARASLSGLGHWPTNPLPKDTVWVTVKAGNATKVTLYQRRQGPFASSQMYDDGKHGDGKANDGVYGASVAPQVAGSIVDYYVEATASSGAVRFLPKTAEFQSGRYRVEWPRGNSPIKINEILAKNVNGIKDSNGEHEDWVELYNASGQTVSVSGMHLSDNFTNSTKWKIPPGQNIPAWSTALIWCDEDGSQGAMHASFKLSSQGEEIGLFSSDGKTLLDTLAFGGQQPDISTGRFFDGGTPWVSFSKPSPRNRNEVFGCATRVYSALDPTLHAMDLALTGAPKIGASMTMNLSGGPRSGSAHLFMSPNASHQMLGLNPDVAVLLDPSQVVGPVPLSLNGQGSLSLPLAIPNIPSAVGKRVCMQLFAIDAARLMASNGAEAMICR
ncbi:MAG: CotH kinase family protein, partial [Planctomycetota bacterium]|nr:CotH kinase family protein [Planctomycetota bacterium]